MHHDEARQVLVFCSESVRYPRPDARPALQEHPGIHFKHRRRVIIRLREARIDERHVVDVLRNVREDLRSMSARFSMLPKLERRRKHLAAGREKACLGIGSFELVAVAMLEFRFVIERVDLRRASRHEEPDDSLGRGGVVRLTRFQKLWIGRRRSIVQETLIAQQLCQTKTACTEGCAFQKLAALFEVELISSLG